MNEAGIQTFVHELMGPQATLVKNGKWVNFSCPFAPFLHQRGTDRKPSAGITIDDAGTSVFNCLACGTKGPLPYILRRISSYTGEDFSDYADSLEKSEMFSGALPEWDAAPSILPRIKPLDFELHADLYDTAVGHPYLRKRKVSKWAARTAQLLVDPGDGKPERILFPVFSRDKEFYGFTGRATKESVEPRIKDYFGLPKRELLLGAHLLRPDDEYVILVEGVFDYARLVGFNYPVVASMGANATEHQLDILRDIGKPVYVFYDNDKAGYSRRREIVRALCQHVPVLKPKYPDVCTIETREGDLRPPKDPAELTEDQIHEMLMTATLG